MLRIREYDGDPSRSRRHGGDSTATGAFDVSPTCRADFFLSKDTSGTSTTNGTAGVSRLLQKRTSSPMISNKHKRSWKQALRHRLIMTPQRIFADLFLPIGYPQSVGEGYLAYQFYDSLQGICSYLRGVVSTSAVLMAAGVGDAEATAMSAAVAWAMRDGVGMIGGLLFSYLASAQFDQCVKEYRLFADVINDVGLTLDMLAPYAGRSRVLYVTSLATVAKTMCGMAAGATKGSITHHFAIRGNMADLNAKESTQETLVSLLGMIMGIGLARYLHALEREQSCDSGGGDDQQACVPNDMAQMISWAIFIILTSIHVWANYLGVKILRLRTLNRERAEVALKDVVIRCQCDCEMAFVVEASHCGEEMNSDDMSIDVAPLVKTPHELSESLWSSTCKLFFPCGIRLGVRLADAFKGVDQAKIMERMEEFKDEKYVLNASVTSLFGIRRQLDVSIVLCVGSNEWDELKAFINAMIFLAVCRKDVTSNEQDVISNCISM